MQTEIVLEIETEGKQECIEGMTVAALISCARRIGGKFSCLRLIHIIYWHILVDFSIVLD